MFDCNKSVDVLPADRSSGYVLYRGPSSIDGQPIVAIATTKTRNRKTGRMYQVWILREDITPIQARQSGRDYSICGNCPHRINRTCYVNVAHAPQQVLRAYYAGRYAPIDVDDVNDLFFGACVRIGAYGDPAAVPIEIWLPILDVCKSYTGYTHQANRVDVAKDIRWRFLMASVNRSADVERLNLAGWRTFRSKYAHENKLESESTCPASVEMGERVTCADCGLCNGLKPARNMVINVHGPMAKIQERKARFNNSDS